LNALLIELKQPIISEAVKTAMNIEKYKFGLTETQLIREVVLQLIYLSRNSHETS
jgi:hypothetical protein